jgi:CCR4-NOT complex subunit CAF16
MSEKYIEIKNLHFKYADKTIFDDLSLDLYSNNCYILAGLNGCGKSTLMKIISGKSLCEYDKVKVLNKDPFRDTSLNNDIAYIDNNWGNQTVAFSGYNVPLQSCLQVKDMMKELKKKYPERNRELLELLDINPEWHLNAVSEGQRKRVQLYLNLIQPFKVCLLDEITVNLDLLVKDRFMNYLKLETTRRNCCIVYVTHIFDGLEEWGTKLIYMKNSNELETTDIDTIPNIYRYLLSNFKRDYVKIAECEDIRLNITQKNAGGYSHGVLINRTI